MMRALWVPDEGAGGALVGTLLAPLPKPVRPLTPDEKATLAVFEDALVNLTKSDSRLAAASGGGRIACGTG